MITKTTVVRGSIVGDDNLVVEGKIEGSVRIAGVLTLGEDSEVKAEIEAESVSVTGSVQGSIAAKERVDLGAKSRFEGTIAAQRLSIEEGATVKGRIEMAFEI